MDGMRILVINVRMGGAKPKQEKRVLQKSRNDPNRSSNLKPNLTHSPNPKSGIVVVVF